MTVSSTTNRVQTAGNGVLTAFPFTFPCFSSAHLKVYLVDADSVATLKTINTHYTVALNASTPGGTVTMLTAPAADESLLILREVPLTQTTDIPEVGSVREENLEDVYDRIYMVLQQLQEKIDRCIIQDVAATGDLQLPAPDPGKILGWSDDGSAIENISLEVTETQYEGSINKGVDASKAASPAAGDIYIATDTGRLYLCFVAGTWSYSPDLNLPTLNAVILKQQSAGPATSATQLGIYVKEVSGQPELFYRKASSGTEVQLTSNGVLNVPVAAMPAGSIIQRVHTQTGAVASGSTAIPGDDTIPQNTEGTEFLTLAITPTDAANKLLIRTKLVLAANASAGIHMALFQDSIANALSAVTHFTHASGGQTDMLIEHEMTAGTTSEITFKVRAGDGGGATITMNGQGGSRYLGGVYNSFITIEETKA